MTEPRQAVSKRPASSFALDLAKNPRVWVGLGIGVVAVAFIIQNQAPVVSNIFAFQFTAPHWVTLTIVFLAGLVAGFLVRRKRRR